MTTSISTPILPTDSAVVALGAPIKTELNQMDGDFGGSFSELFGEALSDLSGTVPINSAMPEQAENLVRQLQSLPQGGKLLPLLTQLLDGSAAAGSDPEQVLSQVNASLEQLSVNGEAANTDLDTLQAIAAALYQVVEANPHYLSKGETQQLPAKQLAGDAWQQLTDRGGASQGSKTIEQPEQEAKLLRVLDSLPPPAAASAGAAGHAQAELAAALHAIRRLTSGQQASQDSLKTDTAASNGTGTAPTNTIAAPPAASGAPTLTLGVPLHQEGWDQALGERIQWMVRQGVEGAQGAQIKLNPAHLGPMEVRIQMQNDQATIQFTATHAVVREALEAALPRLREMLDASGVELVNVDVSGESFAEQQRTGEDRQTAQGASPAIDAIERHETVIETPMIALPEAGRLDLFA